MIEGTTDCTPQLQLMNNPRRVSKVLIHSPTRSVKPTAQLNPNHAGMSFPTAEEYTIDIHLTATMSIDSIMLHPRTNVDSFKVQLHNAHGYYLEIKSNIGYKTIDGLANQQANLIRIIFLGTEDGMAPNHVSLTIVSYFRMNLKNSSMIHI